MCQDPRSQGVICQGIVVSCGTCLKGCKRVAGRLLAAVQSKSLRVWSSAAVMHAPVSQCPELMCRKEC